MRDSNSEADWSAFLQEWQGWISRLFDAQQADQELGEQIPCSWLHLVEFPNATTIQQLWSGAKNSLPRFLDYLSWAILDARIAESEMGYLLVYQLKDWHELEDWYKSGVEEYEDGFMMAGMPVEPAVIANFELEVGPIPNSLRYLWLTHGFVQLRNGTFIASLDPCQQKLAHPPVFYPARRDSWQDGRVLDCLGIADVIGEIVPSLSRQPGNLPWQDYIVDVDRWGETMSQSLRFHLDDMLTDWFLRDWEGGSRLA